MRHKTYKREHRDATKEAERLFRMGYRQTSSRYRIVFRVDVADVKMELLRKGMDNAIRMTLDSCEDYWRRVYSDDMIGGMDEDVMRAMRGMDSSMRTSSPYETVVCIDNAGIEEWFDKGIDYLLQSRSNEWAGVIDKFGVTRKCKASRFGR